jgi:glycosyltransferase involved in cell wall biosynthesis
MPKTHWLGFLNDGGCIDAYNAADVVVVPSRQDNSPQTATEALACGAPVVAFRATGLPDFITHQVTGYLAEPEDPIDLANGIIWSLSDDQRRAALSHMARDRAVSLWSPDVVARQYVDVYHDVIDRTRR